MITIFQDGKKIRYTRGDTFLLKISPEDGEIFPGNSTLEFVIADESSKEPIIDNTYDLSDGAFTLKLEKKDTELACGRYVYKMILKTAEGIVVTQKDGIFEVVWGA